VRVLIYLLIISAAVIIGSGIAIYLIESPHEDAQITNMIDAFWWVSATVTTVGYGDVVPVTEAGRVMGIGLMFVGISIIGVFISSLGARLVGSRIKARTNVAQDTKSMLIKKITHLEKLEQKELEVLIKITKDLHESLRDKKR